MTWILLQTRTKLPDTSRMIFRNISELPILEKLTTCSVSKSSATKPPALYPSTKGLTSTQLPHVSTLPPLNPSTHHLIRAPFSQRTNVQKLHGNLIACVTFHIDRH